MTDSEIVADIGRIKPDVAELRSEVALLRDGLKSSRVKNIDTVREWAQRIVLRAEDASRRWQDIAPDVRGHPVSSYMNLIDFCQCMNTDDLQHIQADLTRVRHRLYELGLLSIDT